MAKTPQIHSCTECESIRCFITDTTLCFHPRHVRHLPNLRRAEKCIDFTEKQKNDHEESDLN